MKRKSRGGKIGPEKRVTPPPPPPTLSTTTTTIPRNMHKHTYTFHSGGGDGGFEIYTRVCTAPNGLARAENHFSHTFSVFFFFNDIRLR